MAGKLGMDIGLTRVGVDKEKKTGHSQADVEEKLRKRNAQVVGACKDMGGTLEAVGKLLEGCMTEENLGAK